VVEATASEGDSNGVVKKLRKTPSKKRRGAEKTPEEIEAQRERRRLRLNAKSLRYQRKLQALETPEQREARLARRRETRKARRRKADYTGEKRDAILKRSRESSRQRRAKESPETRAERLAKLRERFPNPVGKKRKNATTTT